MIAHRYWRLTCATLWDAGQSRTAVGQIVMRGTVGGANLAIAGNGTSLASSEYDVGYVSSKSFLGEASAGASFWFSSTTPTPHWNQWDFGAGNEQIIAQVVLYCPDNTNSGYVKDYIFSFSDDGTTWSQAAAGTTLGVSPSQATTFITVDPILATLDLTAPSPILALFGGGNASAAAPSPTLSSAGGAYISPITAPSPRLIAYGHGSYGEQAAFLTAPRPTLSITAGANAKGLKAPKPTLSSSATVTALAVASLTAPSPTLSTTMTVTVMANANLTFGYVNGWNYTLYSYGGAHALLSPPAAMLTSSSTVGVVASAHLAAPSPALTVHVGGAGSVSAPGATLSAHGFVGGLARVNVAAPAATLVVYSGGAISVVAPAPSLATSSTTGAVASVACSAPRPNLVGYGGAMCSITLTGRATLHATGTTGGIASVAVTAPLFELTCTATAQNHGSMNLLAPSPKLGGQAQAWLIAPHARLTAIGSAVITATYEAYAVNLKHTPRGNEQPTDEVTRYTNFPFTHVVRYQNSYYGANSTGLYLLEGTTDNGTAIPYDVRTAISDFKSPMRKTVASAYFGGRIGPNATVTLHAGEDKQTQAYAYTTPRGQLAQNHRQAFGKGIRQHRYYALEVAGTGKLELDTIELETHNLTRRI